MSRLRRAGIPFNAGYAVLIESGSPPEPAFAWWTAERIEAA